MIGSIITGMRGHAIDNHHASRPPKLRRIRLRRIGSGCNRKNMTFDGCQRLAPLD